jgi:hypothetical protein
MAGQLTIDTLKASSGVLATQNGMTGIAKAWVNFNGTGTVAIRGAFNVSSITDNGVGQYTINFTTAMADANYSVCGCAYNNGAGGESLRINTAPTTSSVQILTSSSGSAFDSLYTTAAIFSS